MEHVIPEQILSTEENPAQGISAVKALAIAGAEGQKIWRINKNNLIEALAGLELGSDIEGEIRNAVLSGKEATAHERFINFAGGKNAGYLLIDPATGAGAYLIASGANGSDVKTAVDRLVDILGKGVSALEEFFDRVGDAGGKSLFNGLGKIFTGLGSFLTILDFRGCSVGTIIAVALLTTMFTLLLAFLLIGLPFLAIFVISAISGFILSRFFGDVKKRYCQLN